MGDQMKNSSEVGRLLAGLFDDMQRGVVLWQLLVIALALLVAWNMSRYMRRKIVYASSSDSEQTMRISFGGMNRELFPMTALVIVASGRWILLHYDQPINLLNIAVPLVLAMAIIRAVVYLLRHTFAPGGMLRSWETAFSWLVWLSVALHIVGLLPALGRVLEDTGFRVGQQRLSLAMVLTALLTVILTVFGALWIGRMLEARIMALQHIEINLRFALTKILRSVLVVVAVLMALPIVGIDITVLSVFGGALGVGIGFGLQKVAANYVSGFIVLLDRSIRVGDMITADNFYGKVREITSRYVLVQSQDGREAIIPNETMVATTVVNHTYTDRSTRVACPVSVDYGTDLDRAMSILREVALAHPRVLKEPEPG